MVRHDPNAARSPTATSLSVERRRWMPAIALLLVAAPGCAIHTGSRRDWSAEEHRAVASQPAPAKSRVWIRSFEHAAVGSVTTAYAVGSGGGSASGIGVTRNRSEQVPQFVIDAFEKAGTFRAVTPIPDMGGPPEYILDGVVTSSWEMPWWTWVQLVDLWAHAFVLPTLGRNLVANAEITLRRPDFERVKTWKIHYEDYYAGQIWWGMTHGGAYDIGTDVEFQKEILAYAAAVIRDDLRK